MVLVADAAVAIRGDLSKFNSDLKGADKPIQSLGARIKSALNPAALIGGGIALAGAAVVAGLAGAVKALIDIERLNAQTDAAIRSTGGVANVTRKGVEALSEEMESLTTIERESVQEGANLLLTFRNIRNEAGKGNDIFDQTTMSMLDMSTAMGTDARTAAMQLGKALNDPIKGLGQLGRVGVDFTDSQEDMIRGMVEAGNVMGAQKIILQELAAEFGGSAEAFANTTAGRVQRFQNDVGNMFESIIVGATKVADFLGQDPMKIGAQMEADAKAARLAVGGETQQMMYDLTRITMRGREPIKTEWDGIMGIPAQAVLDNWDEIHQAGVDTQAAYNAGIFDSQGTFLAEIDALLLALDENLAPGEEIAELRGGKVELMYARGIASEKGDLGAVAAIDAMIADINQRLATLNGYAYGQNLMTTLASGIYAYSARPGEAAGYAATKIRGQLQVKSEPPDPSSPLHGITKWGGNIVKTIADGIYGELGAGANAAGALAGALAPALGMPALGMAGMESGMAGGPTWIVNVNGVQRSVGSPQEAVDALKDLGAFGEGRLN